MKPLSQPVNLRVEAQSIKNEGVFHLKKLFATLGMAASVFALSHSAHAATNSYTVQQGDSLYKIGQKYHVSTSQLESTNHLSGSGIYPGEQLTIPVNGSYSSTYTVKYGDSLYKIARAHHVSISSLKSANHLTSNTIYTGQTLTIPGTGSTVSSTTSYVSNSPYSLTYKVKPGDTLWKIAVRLGSPMADIKAANHLSSNYLVSGQTLTIPQRFSYAQKMLLARLVTAEAQGQPYAAQVGITHVVLNRIASSQFPNTLDGVIYQKVSGHYAFTPVENGTINDTPTTLAKEAVNQAITTQSSNNQGGALFYYNPQKVSNSWILSQPVTSVIGNTTFSK